MRDGNCHPALRHCAVFDVPYRPPGRVQSGVFRNFLPAAVGHTAVGKEAGYYSPPIAIEDLICRWELAAQCPVFS